MKKIWRLLPFGQKKRYHRNPKLSCAPLLIAVALSLAGQLPGPTWANPTGGEVVGGQASIRQAPGLTTIDQQSDRAILNWQQFSIGRGEVTRFNQPGQDAIALNRVVGSDPSKLLGGLQANGHVWLVNQNGILVGPEARVDVHGFLATTADITDENFMAGRFDFSVPSAQVDAGVINQGTISISEFGLAGLVAPHVRNDGIIQARLGNVIIAGTPTYTLDFYGDGLIQFEASSEVQNPSNPDQALVANSGLISADGSTVLISANAAAGVVEEAINMDGVVEAHSVAAHDGAIILDGGDSGIVHVAGKLDVSGTEPGATGGTVKVLGEKVGLFSETTVDASGDSGGGEVLIGGNYKGQGSETNAKSTYVSENADIFADALLQGDGGKIIIWADETTKVSGELSATGGSLSGDGGLVETSSAGALEINSAPDVSASEMATAGTWLIDPYNIEIFWFIEGTPNVGIPSTNPFIATTENAQLAVHLLLSALTGGANVRVSTTSGDSGKDEGNIWLSTPLDFDQTGTNNLTFEAANSIFIDAEIYDRIPGDDDLLNLSLTADTDGDGQGSVIINAPISTIGGDATLTAGDAISLNADIRTYGGNIVLKSNGIVESNGGSLYTYSLSGDSGNIDIEAVNNIVLRDEVASSGVLQGGGGDIRLLSTNGDIDTTLAGLNSSAGTAGDAGTINLTALNNVNISSIWADSVGGQKGTIRVTSLNQSINLLGDDSSYGGTVVLRAGDQITQATSSYLATEHLGLQALSTPVLNLSKPVETLAADITGVGASFSFTNPADLSIGQVDSLIGVQTNGGDIFLEAEGNLTVNDPLVTSGNIVLRAREDIITATDIDLTAQGADKRFVLQAGDNITLNNPITTYGADLHLEANSPHMGFGTDGLTGGVVSNAPITTNGGDITVIGTGEIDMNAIFDAGDGTIAHSPPGNYSIVGNAVSNFLTNARTTGKLILGQAQSAGEDGLGTGQLTFTASTLTLNETTINPAVAGEVELLATNGISFEGVFTTSQPLLINADADDDGTGEITTLDTQLVPGGLLQLQAGDGIDIETVNLGAVAAEVMDGNLSIANIGGADVTIASGSSVSGVSATQGTVELQTDGRLLLEESIAAGVSSGGEEHSILLVVAEFQNLSGANSLDPGAGERYLVYSKDPANDDRSGITDYLKIYNFPFDPADPDGSTSGLISTTDNYFLYDNTAVLNFIASPVSREYGEQNPDSLPYSVTGLVDGDLLADAVEGDPTLGTEADSGSNVGSYPITVTLDQVSSPLNYQLNPVDGTLSVTPASLNIIADDASREYGLGNPPFTATYAGFRGDDDSSVVFGLQFDTLAHLASPVGGYSITPYGATADNYDISYTEGILSVTPASLNIIADDASREYGLGNPPFTATYAGFRGDDDSSVVFGLQFDTPAQLASPVGGYSITPYGATADNYDISYTEGILSVTPASLNIIADDVSRNYGLENPPFTATYAGFRGDDNPSIVSGLQFETSAQLLSPAASYSITPYGAIADNYDIFYTDGTLTVKAVPFREAPPIVINLPEISERSEDPGDSEDRRQKFIDTIGSGENLGASLPIVLSIPDGPVTAVPAIGRAPVETDLLYPNDGNNELWDTRPKKTDEPY